MRLTIHDAEMQQVAWVDNDKQQTLNYYDDTWTRYLETGASTFEFTVFKKSIQSDTATEKAYNLLNDRAFVSFIYKGETFIFSVMELEEDEHTIHVIAENLNFELINEKANAYKSNRAMTIVEYMDAMDLRNFTTLRVGVNEVSDRTRTLEWEGRETKLARLISLVSRFDAELEFRTELNRDGTVKSFIVNIYKENDGTNHGVGKVRGDLVLRYGENVKSIIRSIDKRDIVNAIQPVGKDGLTIAGMSDWQETNADGELEFYQRGTMLYAPLSMQRYPSAFTSKTTNDQWTRGDIDIDTDSQTVLRAGGIKELRKLAYPSIEYTIKGFLDADIGDTVTVEDDGFVPMLILSVRIAKQKISFTDPKRNETEVGNVRALANRLSDDIQAQLDRMVEEAKAYTIRLSTDNGVLFKNGLGQSTLVPSLYKGTTPVPHGVSWNWFVNGVYKTTGASYTVQASTIEGTQVVKAVAIFNGQNVAEMDTSFVNVLDGAAGLRGERGRDGRDTILHTAYANSADGSVDFSVDNPDGRSYMGHYSDYEIMDSLDFRRYTWAKIKGDKGDRGSDGVAGKNGVGIKSTVITYGTSTSESTPPATWTTSVPTLSKGQYLWTRTVWTYSDNTSETGYQKTYIARDGNNGTDGVAGKDGVGILSTTITYAASSSGTTPPTSGWTATVPTVPEGQFLWTRTVWRYTDNTSETGYSAAKMGQRGADGSDGDGITGTTTYYLATTAASGVTRQTSGWTTVPQQTTESIRYLWSYREETYTSGKRTYTTPAIIGTHGARGAQGAQGAQGIAGAKGADGQTLYTWIKYADSPVAGMSDTPTGKHYIGIAYNKTTATESSNYSDYSWSLIKGADGVQGARGADGQTFYTWIKYADDERGSGMSDSPAGKRYLGLALNRPTASKSTNPSDYLWSPLFDNVQVGGVNLIPNALMKRKSDGQQTFTVGGVTHKNKLIENWNNLYNSGLPSPTTIYHAYVDETFTSDGAVLKFDETNGGRNWKAFNVNLKNLDLSIGSYFFSFDCYVTGEGTKTWFGIYYFNKQGNRNFHAGQTIINPQKINTWERLGGVCKINDDIDFTKEVRFYFYAYNFTSNSVLYARRPKLEHGNIGTPFSEAPEDFEVSISAKADQTLTQYQLEQLAERARILEVETQAKADAAVLQEWVAAYQEYVKADAAGRANSEEKLARVSAAVDAISTDLGELAQRWNFLDTYMKVANDGLVFGKKDGSTSIRIDDGRIGMYSGGNEVMYITQGVLHIDNGVFTKTIQVGRFVESQHEINLDMNVVRYVGGKT